MVFVLRLPTNHTPFKFRCMFKITDERIVDDESQKLQVIHLLELVTNRNVLTHEQNIITNNPVPLWMEKHNKF